MRFISWIIEKNYMSRINQHQKEYKEKIELTKTPLAKDRTG